MVVSINPLPKKDIEWQTVSNRKTGLQLLPEEIASVSKTLNLAPEQLHGITLVDPGVAAPVYKGLTTKIREFFFGLLSKTFGGSEPKAGKEAQWDMEGLPVWQAMVTNMPQITLFVDPAKASLEQVKSVIKAIQAKVSWAYVNVLLVSPDKAVREATLKEANPTDGICMKTKGCCQSPCTGCKLGNYLKQQLQPKTETAS